MRMRSFSYRYNSFPYSALGATLERERKRETIDERDGRHFRGVARAHTAAQPMMSFCFRQKSPIRPTKKRKEEEKKGNVLNN